MKIPSNIEVLSITPVADGKLMLLLLRDRNSGSEYFYNIPGNIGGPPMSVFGEGIFPE